MALLNIIYLTRMRLVLFGSERPPLKLFDSSPEQRKETLFILGSGPTLNLLQEEDWRHIKSEDSVGFNTFVLHRFNPTILCLELQTINSDNSEYLDWVNSCLNAKDGLENFKKIVIKLPRSKRWNKDELRSLCNFSSWPVELSPLLVLAPRNIRDLKNYFSKDSIWLYLAKFIPSWATIEADWSVVWAVLSAYRRGYKRVVLCGISPSTQRYWWQADKGGLDTRAAAVPGRWAPLPNSPFLSYNDVMPVSVLDSLEIVTRGLCASRSNFQCFAGFGADECSSFLPVYFERNK